MEPPAPPGEGRIWPSPGYLHQVERLKGAIGQRIYLVEIKPGDINLGVRLSDTSYELLGVLDFPRPDPLKGLAPHLLLLDDGRGLNLGRVIRVSINSPFSPPEADILYQESFLMERLLTRESQLTKETIAARSRMLLGRLLGKGGELSGTN
ncbi:MAG: hypothetical protein KJ558_05615 [Gammaproteobacteria bacterium]|nr:hypothetical protein [Gammaproteobacteria bacterium]MBU1654293.1 hypothetical protein [Gammaproteobacteria bacterium]MBU1961232.1 hypothetical protein [Gammaproteobacteria bacterium]